MKQILAICIALCFVSASAAVPKTAAVVTVSTSSSVVLKWSAVPLATSYKVYEIITGKAETLLATTTTTSYTVTMAKGNSYSFRVVTVDASGSGPTSGSVTSKASAP
jgi:fibronectin type 3 domain-containing protein